MPHHREGIQEQLDKAYDEGHRDNEAIDADKIVSAEMGHVDDKEMRGKLSLEETVALLNENGYLDASFEGKEVHKLVVKALSKEEAITEYKKSGGVPYISQDLESNMPYLTPNVENLDVMIMNFGKEIKSPEALTEMDRLGVRPLTYEELIQYGVTYPSHQQKNDLVGLGSKYTYSGGPRTPVLLMLANDRELDGKVWGLLWDSSYRFPVVRK